MGLKTQVSSSYDFKMSNYGIYQFQNCNQPYDSIVSRGARGVHKHIDIILEISQPCGYNIIGF